MKKENISLESITRDSKEISQKINELKNKLENEINHIKELYEKTEQEISRLMRSMNMTLRVHQRNWTSTARRQILSLILLA